MDSCRCWYLIFVLINSIQSHSFLLSNEPTLEKQTSTKSTDQRVEYQSTITTSLATFTTTIRSSSTIQSLITKRNSYLYNPDEEETLLDRIKRDAAPFVCKSKTFIVRIG